ncbi:MAG: hypothetical protein ACO20W_07045, partial [Anaerohalosphaeraceae bacterium]
MREISLIAGMFVFLCVPAYASVDYYVSSSPSVHIEVEVYNNYDLLLQKYIGNSVSSETTSVEIIDDRLEHMLLSWNQELIINDSFSDIPFRLGYFIT